MDTQTKQTERIQEKSTSILEKYNLHTNLEKSEITVLKGNAVKINETWRRVKKIESLLRDEKEIVDSKILATAAFSRLLKIWKRSIQNNNEKNDSCLKFSRQVSFVVHFRNLGTEPDRRKIECFSKTKTTSHFQYQVPTAFFKKSVYMKGTISLPLDQKNKNDDGKYSDTSFD